MKPLTLYDFLRVGHVKRWHNVNTNRDQTVAEHSYMVALIAVHMAVKIVGDPDFTAAVMFEAFFHDMPEVVSGDMPTPAKRFFRELVKDPDIFKKVDAALMPQVPYWPHGWYEDAGRFVTMADAIEGAHWIGENGVGNHAKIVAAANWRRLEDLVEKNDIEQPTAGWYEAVNEVLMALGMRYVHKQSRITPP